MSKIRKIAVYGSLLSGLHNHRIIKNHIKTGHAKLVGEDVLNIPYRMFDLGSYPGLIPVDKDSKNENIYVEIYEIDDDCNSDIESLEGFISDGHPKNYYNKELVESKHGNVEIYIYNRVNYRGLSDVEVHPVNNGVVNWRDMMLIKNFKILL